jgi:hypothetical protein
VAWFVPPDSTDDSALALVASIGNRIGEELLKNNRSKLFETQFQRKRHSNQTVWLVIFGLTGPICAREFKV